MPVDQQPQQNPGLNLKVYTEAKAAKVARVVCLGPETYQILLPRFDVRSGKQLRPFIIQVDLEELKKQRAEKQAEADKLAAEAAEGIAGFDTLIADLEALPVPDNAPES